MTSNKTAECRRLAFIRRGKDKRVNLKEPDSVVGFDITYGGLAGSRLLYKTEQRGNLKLMKGCKKYLTNISLRKHTGYYGT